MNIILLVHNHVIKGRGQKKKWEFSHVSNFQKWIFKHGLNHPEIQRNFISPLYDPPLIREDSLFFETLQYFRNSKLGVPPE